jgi:hypothetical protein
MRVQKLCEEFLEGVVLEVTFRLGPELGILFINLKWNVSALWYRPNVLTRTAEIPHSWRTKEWLTANLRNMNGLPYRDAKLKAEKYGGETL